jgi:hypothetical protein
MNAINQKTVSTSIFRLVLLLFVMLLMQAAANAQSYTPEEQNCYDLVQNKVAWDTGGSKSWNEANVRNLCRGATSATARVGCFQTWMPSLGWSQATQKCTLANEKPVFQGMTNPFPDRARDVDAKYGHVWVVGTKPWAGGYQLWHQVNGGPWETVDAGAIRVAVGANGNPWIVNSAYITVSRMEPGDRKAFLKIL